VKEIFSCVPPGLLEIGSAGPWGSPHRIAFVRPTQMLLVEINALRRSRLTGQGLPGKIPVTSRKDVPMTNCTIFSDFLMALWRKAKKG
jgi:hypothetical protein